MERFNEEYAKMEKPMDRDVKGNRLDSEGNIMTEERSFLGGN